MSPVSSLTVLLLVWCHCLSLFELVPLPDPRPPYRSSSHDGHRVQAQAKKDASSGSKGSKHQDQEASHKDWNEGQSGGHSSSDNEAKKHKQGSHWNNYGETEKIVKDKGHGYVKAFSWDREEIKKDKWGKKGGTYDQGFEKKAKEERKVKRKHKSGHEKKSAAKEAVDHSLWDQEKTDDAYAGLTWQDLQALQGLL